MVWIIPGILIIIWMALVISGILDYRKTKDTEMIGCLLGITLVLVLLLMFYGLIVTIKYEDVGRRDKEELVEIAKTENNQKLNDKLGEIFADKVVTRGERREFREMVDSIHEQKLLNQVDSIKFLGEVK